MVFSDVKRQAWWENARREPEFMVLRQTPRAKKKESGEVEAPVSAYCRLEVTGALKRRKDMNYAMPERCYRGRGRAGTLGNHRRSNIFLKISKGPGPPVECRS